MAMDGAARRAGRAAAHVAVGCILCLAAACATVQPQSQPAEALPPPAVVLSHDEELPPPPRPPRKPTPPTLAALTPPVPEPPPPPAAETPAPSFDKLQGLDQKETAAFLGEPAERAEAPPAVLWRYASRDCALDVYFYLDLESREMRVLHYEVRNTDGSERPQQSCYDEFVTARAAEQTGSSDRPR